MTTKKMELKEKLLSSFMAFEARVDVQTELHDLRTAAIKNFEHKGNFEGWIRRIMINECIF